jgi:hypothetical protein
VWGAANAMPPETEKGHKLRPFSFIFMLPVGLADVMDRTLRAIDDCVNREIGLVSLQKRPHPKARPV